VRLLALLCLITLAGCTTGQQSIVDTLNTAIRGDKDVTVADEKIQSLPYSTMYLTLNNGQRVLVVLGYIEQGNSKWLSQDRAMLVTRQGRLLKTVNLPDNLLEIITNQDDPLVHADKLSTGDSWSRSIMWTEDGQLRSSQLTSRFSRAEQDEVLTIAGNNIACEVWYEDVQSQTPKRNWRNTFWVDKQSGEVRQSHQMMGAGDFPVKMTMLKPAP